MICCEICTGLHSTDTHLPAALAELGAAVTPPPHEVHARPLMIELIRVIKSVVGDQSPIQALETPYESPVILW